MRRALIALATALTALVLAVSPVPDASAGGKKVPGTSIVDSVLQRDIAQQVAMLEMMFGADCKDARIINAEVTEPPAVVNVDKWVERWTVDRCGKLVYYRVVLTPGKRGGTDYKVSLLEDAE